MNHIIILTLVMNLIAGTAVFLYSLSAYRKFRRPFLRTFLSYILSFNGLVIIYFTYQYILINVFGGNIVRILDYPALFSILLILVYCAEFSMTISLFCLVKHMRGGRMSGRAKGLFALWLIIFGAASAYGMVLFSRTMQWKVFYWIHAGWICSMDLIILLILLVTSVTALGRRGLDRNSMRSFSLFFLAGYTAFAVSHLDFYLIHSGFSKYYDPMILLLINLCPLLWLRFFFEKDNRSASTSDVEETLARFCGKFGISKRERDIIEQVMLGKSNKGIEKVLFISHNTVKNHIYNIFRKTGVGSRSELIHRINRFQD